MRQIAAPDSAGSEQGTDRPYQHLSLIIGAFRPNSSCLWLFVDPLGSAAAAPLRPEKRRSIYSDSAALAPDAGGPSDSLLNSLSTPPSQPVC